MTIALPRAPRRPSLRRPTLQRPRMGRRQTVRFAITLLVALGIAMLTTGATLSGAFERAQLIINDSFFKSNPIQPAEYSVLVGVDDKSVADLRSYGRLFVWPRSLYAQVID